MTKGSFSNRALSMISAVLLLSTTALAVTQADVLRLKEKAARGDAFTTAERQLAADAQQQLGSKFTWPQQANPRRPHNPLDEYIVAETTYEWIDITGNGNNADIVGDDQTVGPFNLGFSFPYYDFSYTQVYMTSNGWATFQDQGGWAQYWNEPIPNNIDPSAALYIFWDDLYPPSGGQYYYYADAANQRFIMSWINVPHIGTTDEVYSFQIVLTPDGLIRYNYQFVSVGGIYGNLSCTVGIENENSTDGLQVCYEGTGLLPTTGMSLLIGQPDGVPAPVTNLAAVVNGHDVTLTWTDPTQDTNGNPLTLTNLQVWSGRPGSGTLMATVAPGVQTALLANLNDGSRSIYVRAYASPYYGAADRVNIIVGTPSYANSFDVDDGMWTTNAGWAWRTPTNFNMPGPNSPPNTWGTDFPNGYPDFSDYSLQLDLGLTVANPDAMIEFYCWYDAEFFWDGCNFKVSVDNGDTWTIVQPVGGYPVNALNNGTANPLAGEPAWSGQSLGWQYVNIPLGAYEGQAPIFRFHFGSDEVVSGYAGIYIDDVIIWGLAPPVLATVSGNVTLDGGNGTITSVQVRADGIGSPSTTPAANGSYTLANVLVGNRRIRGILPGYHTTTQIVAVPEGGIAGVNLTLTRLDPPAPTNLTGSVNNATGLVSLDWDNSVDPLVDGYRIYRRLAGEQDFVQVGTSVASAFQETLTSDGIYQYTVTAVDNDVSVPVQSPRSNQVTVLFGELPVTQLGTNGNFDDRIRLSWLTPGTLEGTELFYDDGTAEAFYVVAFPAGPSDYFCVRMTPPDDAAYPLMIYSVTVFVEDQIEIPWIGICPPMPGGEGADVSNAYYEWTGLSADASPGWVMAETDGGVFLSEPGDFYIAYQFPPGMDDQPAVGSDETQVDNRSYWTQDPNGFWNLWNWHDWMMRAWLGGPPPEGGLSLNQEFYMLSTGTPGGYAVERVPSLPTSSDLNSSRVITGGDVKELIARGPVANSRTSRNPLDRWFAPFVEAPTVELVTRDPRRPLDDIVSYRVYRGGTMIAQPVETNYTDLNRIENTPYSYYVTAMYDNGVESSPSPTRTAMCNMAPAAPSGLTGVPVGNTQMALAWVAPTTNRDGTPLVDLAQYRVYRNGVQIGTTAPGVTTFTDTPPQNDGFYTWTVTAQDEVPNISNPSPPFVGAVVSPFESVDYEWVDISGVGTELTFEWWGATAGPIELGFSYPYLEQEYSQVYVSPGGWASFIPVQGYFFSEPIPGPFEPHAVIYPFWDELTAGLDGGRVLTYQDAAEDRFIITWENLPHLWDFSFRYTFQLILEEGGAAIFNYHTIPADGWPGNADCTVGVEDATSESAIQVFFNGAGAIAPQSQTSIAFWAGPSGTITGIIREFGSNLPLQNVRVTVDQVPDLFVLTDAAGVYLLEVEPGTYTVRVHLQGYCDQNASNVVVEDDGTAARNFLLRQPNAAFSVTSLNVLSVVGQNATAQFEISNPQGQCDLEYSITTSQAWLTVSNPTGTITANQSQLITVTGATAEFAPGDYTATIIVAHNDHNSPLNIPVTVSQASSVENNPELPSQFALHQNYPNPFNASTVLSFDVPQESKVTLILYNVQGQEVARPIDRPMAAGRHAVHFDAGTLPTGMYLVKMSAGDFSAVHKMVLLK